MRLGHELPNANQTATWQNNVAATPRQMGRSFWLFCKFDEAQTAEGLRQPAKVVEPELWACGPRNAFSPNRGSFFTFGAA